MRAGRMCFVYHAGGAARVRYDYSMAVLLAESIPPDTHAWAILWLVVLCLGMLGLLMVIWIISRRRIQRSLDGPPRPPRATTDPWLESARRLDARSDDRRATGETDEA